MMFGHSRPGQNKHLHRADDAARIMRVDPRRGFRIAGFKLPEYLPEPFCSYPLFNLAAQGVIP